MMIIGTGTTGLLVCSVAGCWLLAVRNLGQRADTCPKPTSAHCLLTQLGRYCVMLQQARCRLKADTHSSKFPPTPIPFTPPRPLIKLPQPPRTLVLEPLCTLLIKTKTTVLSSLHLISSSLFLSRTLPPTTSPNLPLPTHNPSRDYRCHVTPLITGPNRGALEPVNFDRNVLGPVWKSVLPSHPTSKTPRFLIRHFRPGRSTTTRSLTTSSPRSVSPFLEPSSRQSEP